jgi:hypothetical protein
MKFTELKEIQSDLSEKTGIKLPVASLCMLLGVTRPAYKKWQLSGNVPRRAGLHILALNGLSQKEFKKYLKLALAKG